MIYVILITPFRLPKNTKNTSLSLGRMSFTCLPNEYSQAPYIFTKILKVPFGYLRKNGHPSVVYIDDTYLQGDSLQLCQNNVWATEELLWDLEFHIHPDKSVLTPSQQLGFLGFILDSNAVTLTDKRKQKILVLCQGFLDNPCQKIREIASLVGCLIAALCNMWSTVLPSPRAL